MINNRIKIIPIILITFLVIQLFAPAIILASTTGKVKEALNMRKGPGTNYDLICVLKKGTTVTIIDDSSHWYKIKVNGLTGYASSNYIETNKEKSKQSSYSTTNYNSSGSILISIIEIVIDIIKAVINSFSDILANTNASNITAKQLKVSDRAKNLDAVIDGVALCQGWVANVYFTAGANLIPINMPTARMAGEVWGVSKDFSKIQVGATVYGDIGDMGHVGIYCDNGYVYHNSYGTIKKDKLSSWISKYNGKCWGWNGGVDLTGGKYPISGKNLMK